MLEVPPSEVPQQIPQEQEHVNGPIGESLSPETQEFFSSLDKEARELLSKHLPDLLPEGPTHYLPLINSTSDRYLGELRGKQYSGIGLGKIEPRLKDPQFRFKKLVGTIENLIRQGWAEKNANFNQDLNRKVSDEDIAKCKTATDLVNLIKKNKPGEEVKNLKRAFVDGVSTLALECVLSRTIREDMKDPFGNKERAIYYDNMLRHSQKSMPDTYVQGTRQLVLPLVARHTTKVFGTLMENVDLRACENIMSNNEEFKAITHDPSSLPGLKGNPTFPLRDV